MAQKATPEINITDMQIKQQSDELNIYFVLHASKKATPSDYNVIIQPVLRQLPDSLLLPEIVIQGKKARISEQRHLLATGEQRPDSVFYTENGESIPYDISVPYENWMAGSELILNGMSIGCCSVTEMPLGVLAENILSQPVIVKQPEAPVAAVVEVPSFVSPASEYKEGEPQEREGALSVYFRQGKSLIEPEFRDNYNSLVELISTIRKINSSADSRVAHIVIAGFASPEGSPSFNEQLAGDRAMALKYFIADNGRMREDLIHLYNGAIDWEGLRILVSESNMREKTEIINIIDNVPQRDSRYQVGRLESLKRLNGGSPYRYMLDNFFPLLRNAAYVRVYYENLH